jgi:hypothetical protein
MADANFDYKYISAAGSAVLKSQGGQLGLAIINGPYTGTVTLFDNATGTSASTIAVYGTPSLVPNSVGAPLSFHNGLYYVATGTPSITVTFR